MLSLCTQGMPKADQCTGQVVNLPTPSALKPLTCPNGGKTFEPDTHGRLWVQWRCTGPAWSETLNKVKGLQDRNFDPNGKLWTCKDTQDNRKRLLDWGFLLQGTLATPSAPLALPGAPAPREIAPWVAPWLGVEVPDLGLPLFPYQREGLQMLEYRKGSGALLYDMGLGKSLTSLAWLKWKQEDRPALVITTASTKTQWPREAKKWGVQGRTEVLSGHKARPIPPRSEIVFINWDILTHWQQAIAAWDPKIIIADEVQAVGNSTSKRTKAFRNMVKGRRLIALSGTPMTSKPAQLWTLANALDPAFCNGKEFTFLNRFCQPKPGFGGRMTYAGASNVEELHERVRTWSLRKTKGDVLKDLPDRVYTPVFLDCEVSKEYREAEARILSMQGTNTALLQERLTALTASAYDMKKESVISWVADFLESTDEKLVLWSWHRAAMDHLEAHFGKACVRVSGGISQGAKDAAIQRFTKDATCRVFIGQIASAGVGIDGLQKVCSTQAFVETCWSWSLVDQATSRLHRIGQHDSVGVYYLMAPDSIDEIQVSVLESRRRTAATILDGKTDFSEDAESGVLEGLKLLKGR